MDENPILITLLVFGGFVLSIGGCAFVYPQYSVYSAKLAGEAELRRAEQNRRIAVEEANARKSAAQALADAEIIRAKGVAEANRIVGESLKDSENYLRYLWIDSLGETKNQIIYVPTEAGLPVLEAGRGVK